MKIKNNINESYIDGLYKMMYTKGISQVQMAKDLGYSKSAISHYFTLYQSCQKKHESIKNYIESYEAHIKIPQMFYGSLEIDNREKDIVIIAMVEKTETNLIQIERSNIKKLIKILKNSDNN